MVQTSQMNIPLNSTTGFFTAPYNQQLADRGITQEEYQTTLFRISHKKQHSGKPNVAVKLCNIFNFSASFCCCFFMAFILALTFLMMQGTRQFSVNAIRTVIETKGSQTQIIAFKGPQEKVYDLEQQAKNRCSLFKSTTNPTLKQLDDAFKNYECIYLDMEVLDESNKITLCNKLKENPKGKLFFGGFKNDFRVVNDLRKCSRSYFFLEYIGTTPFSAYLRVMFFYFILFACILGTPFCCCFGFRLCSKKTNSKGGMESILMEETLKYHQKGVQFLFNSITNSIDVVFYNGPVPQFIPQQIPQQQQQFRPQYVQQQQQQQQQVFVPQQQQFVQPQYREVHQQNVQIQPQFSVQPTFTVQQQNQTENIYYSSKVEEVPEESQTQAFLYPKQQGIINGDKFE